MKVMTNRRRMETYWTYIMCVFCQQNLEPTGRVQMTARPRLVLRCPVCEGEHSVPGTEYPVITHELASIEE